MFLIDFALAGGCDDVSPRTSYAWLRGTLGTASVPVNNSEPAAETSTPAEKLVALRRVVVV